MRLISSCLVLAIVPTLAAAPKAGARYRVRATTAVTLSLPAPGRSGEHLYRDASGRWAPLLHAQQAGGVLTFTLSPDQMAGGSTTVLVNKPKWLNANDAAPPQLLKILVDGKPAALHSDIRLGWIDAPPRSVELHVADDLNPIDPASVRAEVDGRVVRPGDRPLQLIQDTAHPRAARILADPEALAGAAAWGTRRITFHCDDFAPDDDDLEVQLTYTVTSPPAIELSKPASVAGDGTKIFCDSIHKGYENVECLLDGKLQTPGATTYGCTWASAETDADHWVCFVFPKPRVVAGLDISWAHYRETFWTSQRYDIMTWDGKAWQRALRVQENPEAQTSKHSFPPRRSDRVLIWVPAGGNHARRPNLTWMTEVAFVSPR